MDRGPGVLTTNFADAVYRFIERVSRPPFLDVFGAKPFSKEWMVAASCGP